MAASRLPVVGERVEYRAAARSPVYTGTATGKPCRDAKCRYVHVVPDVADLGPLHHIDPAYFLRPGQAGRFARVVAEKENA